MNKLAIIILHKNLNEMLFKCLKSIQEKTTLKEYHVYIADTGSEKSNLFELQLYLKENFKQRKNVTLISFDYYDFGKNVNEVIQTHLKDEDLIVFCNNDIEFITNCLDEMVNTYTMHQNVGTVGAKLYYQDNSIQHKGIYLKRDNNNIAISHNNLRERDNFQIENDLFVKGNTAALMLIDKNTFEQIGRFPFNYIDSLHDVEIALRCFLQNKHNILCGKALAYHYESQTRKSNGRLVTQDYQTLKSFIFQNLTQLESIL